MHIFTEFNQLVLDYRESVPVSVSERGNCLQQDSELKHAQINNLNLRLKVQKWHRRILFISQCIHLLSSLLSGHSKDSVPA